ncbi:MAG: hypothetical protein M1830_010266 [Pleopsidium flavum]|nr:MAG: hypothetical protein M1830_010266 [Pleopsidium flavum]
MQEWPFKPNLEMYLMQILQESSCLLEGTNEQLSGPKGPTELRNAKDAIALEDFFDKALERLFDILDGEPSRAAIPPGVIKLCHAILRKVKEPKKQLAAEIFIVSKWFFSTFLLNSIICPESHGIMLGYHISEIARQKILRELAVRASKQVVDLTSHWRQPVPVLPETRNHIEHIFSLIRWSESKDIRPTILPTSSVLPSQDTSDNQPYIVVSPTDLITLVKTLFPETHQASPFTEVDGQPSGLRSRASSVSAVSSSIHANSRSHRGFDSVSVLSTSGSSMTSDTTSREPLLDTLGQQVEQSISTLKRTSRQNLRSAYSESESKVAQGFGQKLRLSCSEMSRILGHNAMAGTCHPCAEQWAVLYAINDGMQLSIETDMIEVENVDDEGYDDESSDDGNGNEQNFHSLNFGRDYHQLKEAIAKLLTESYLPEEFTLQSNGEHFSNRISIHRKRDRHIAPLGFTARRSVPFASRNPYYTQNQPSELVVESPRNDKNISRALVDEQRACHSETREIDEGPKLTIESMLEMALNRSQDQDDFVTAHYWWTTLQQLRRVSSNSLTRDGYGPLLHYFSREARESLRECGSAIEASEAWLVWIRQTRDRQEILAGKKFKDLGTLRDKMWYVTDVKNSSPYEKTRNIAMALKKMARPLRLPQSKPHSTSRPRNMPRSSTGTFTNNTETQFFEIMAASREQGGPNKLADGQADKTQKWLMQSGVENFCKGEERIHRFCLEIQECVDKLVGEHMLDSPVLWSSELYYREKDLYEDSSRNSTLDIPGIATPGSREFELSFVRPRSQGHSFLPRPGQEIYAVSGRNTSQQSFQSARWNTSRDSNATHRGDFQDYLGSGSPILTIDSSATFWSPYETQGRRPESSSRSRPATAPSMNETRMSENADNTSRKRLTFLSDLKQKLTNLILSDLGTTLWSRGSETDAWFSGDLGEECMHKKLTDSAYGKKMTEIPSIRSTNAPDISWDPSVSEERCRTSMAFLTRLSPPLHDANSETVSEVQQIADLSNSNRQLNAGAIPGYKRQFKFPYRTAYRRLLGTFSTHPSPLMKLQALYDLELLIIAFLTSDPRHSQHSQHSTVTFGSESPTSGTVPRSRTRGINVPMTRATRLEEVIANCEERRFNTIALAKRSSISHRSHPTGPPKRAPSTDMIVDMIQELLRDGDIRPKTLFRDLQYIAAFVPADILDKTERGKAFWDVGLAALGLKQDVCRTMVEIADGVVAHHTNKRSQIRPVQGADTEGLARFGMEDAARMWMITAKEGDPVAERELAIFYLTHPELLPRIMLPLTMPRDTFKAEMMYRRIEDPARSDPQTMCVAIHWMELSANGGDKLAKKYLRQRDELNALP